MPVRVKNVAAGFVDEEGQFHPIRDSYDYNSKRAGDAPKKAKRKAKAKGKKKNPITRTWKTAKVRRNPNGDVQVLITPGRTKAKRKRKPARRR